MPRFGDPQHPPDTRAGRQRPADDHAGVSSPLEQGRACFERREWNDAFHALALADASVALGPEDLHRLAWAAGLTARDDAMLATLERLYQRCLELGSPLAAARAAFWLGFRLFVRGESGRAGGWLSRAQALVDRHGDACVEQGYLLLPAIQRHLNQGDFEGAESLAARAAGLGEQFAEADLLAFARNLQGRSLLGQGRLDRGLRLLDEAMVAACSGDLSPIVTGIVFCSGIASCQRVFAFDRTREWTEALTRWCDENPQLVIFTGHCLVHRAQALQVSGAWSRALAEAGRAVARCVRDMERDAAGQAHYQQAEIHRLRGEFAQAESAYRAASRSGVEPQPGLALLRLAQGKREAATSAIRRVVGSTHDRLKRTAPLAAYVEIVLAAGSVDSARAASRELDEIAARYDVDALHAIAAHARGAVHLAGDDAGAALGPIRWAIGLWRRLGAPYLAARSRMLLAQCCAAVGDLDGARLELDAAREMFADLGAHPDVAATEALQGRLAAGDAPEGIPRALSERELQVLRLIATGMTNKAAARALQLSEKTIDRHVSNIFSKLAVSTRAAATAYAYKHALV